jgi:hypothetical protein
MVSSKLGQLGGSLMPFCLTVAVFTSLILGVRQITMWLPVI